MKVLIIGSGGREHSLLKACLKSPLVDEVVAAPGNGGMAAEARCLAVDIEDGAAVLALARQEAAELVIVGPEAPLAVGVADTLREAGIAVYGPGKAGAELEASKAFSKEFMQRHQIPTAGSATFSDYAEALEYLKDKSYPIVIKASGLAAGKGVIIPQNFEDAQRTIHEMLVKNVFGDSGHTVLIEDFMDGEEASIMLMVSGEQYVQLPPSQDHKRVGEGDTGPNTGGMGAYTPAPVVTPEIAEKIRTKIIEPSLKGLKSDGVDYRGTLYVGVMVVKGEPFVVEYNVRFGDPECQILLPLLEDDPIKLMLDCANGTLEPANVKVKDEHAMIVVMAAGGYPGPYGKGDVITFPESIPDNCSIVHAGTKLNDAGEIVTAGGRVLGVVATGPTLQAAADDAYALAKEVKWSDAFFRKDIGWRVLGS
ncbi:phosphoribosylamine--glycine ligase [Rubellicoccus peritrichatus]|uniref:Phosphoribosylamine--glycine ligase n=1 Tax=Rubellicoccus peritrichatus TaxID=3080537 RepID=A0AAQ3LAF9_9BACT|nr:phosphoribosylamine--glycine ligase [Puniceicoccus sp. CR14]WOO39898.1 phosphoribosylamine--glycine ligase [Puniceicoccus sp. CR14]